MCVSLSLMSDGMAAGATPAQQMAGGLALDAGGAGLAALGSLASGVVRAAASRADAAGARSEGLARASRIRTAGRAETGRSRGDAVGAGVSLNSSSVLQADRQITQNVEQDALSAIATGESRARALQAEGRQDLVNGALGAMSGGMVAASKWKRAKGIGGGSPGDGLSQGDRRQIGVY